MQRLLEARCKSSKQKRPFMSFYFGLFSSKTHAHMHSDTLTGSRSQCCGWPPWPVVWFTECEAPQQRVVNSAALTFHTSPPNIWPAKQATPKHCKQTWNNSLFAGISTVLIAVGATWCILRQKFSNWQNKILWSSGDTMKFHYLRMTKINSRRMSKLKKRKYALRFKDTEKKLIKNEHFINRSTQVLDW